MSTILAYVDLTVAGYVAVFVATLVFSQKIKDFFAGIPAHSRANFNAVEAKVLAQVKAYEADLIGKIVPVPAAPVPPAA